MKSIALAMVVVSLIVSATLLIIYGHGDTVGTCVVIGFFLVIFLGGDI